MEYSLLKTIENNIGGPLLPKERFPRLSSFPSTDFVNPGLGQICRLYSFYVPLYSNRNLHELRKKNSLENLEGSGVNEETNLDEKSFEPSEQLEKDPIEFNLEKRKRLGAAVQESFLHPKIIKTDKIFFAPPEKNEPKTQSNLKIKNVQEQQSPLKHKFKFVN